MRQRISELERQIEQGKIPRHRVGGFMEAVYANLRREWPRLPPDTVVEGACLLERHGYTTHAKKLKQRALAMAVYDSSNSFAQVLESQQSDCERFVVERHEENALVSLVHWHAKKPADYHPFVQNYLDERAQDEMTQLEAGLFDSKVMLEFEQGAVIIPSVVSCWGVERGLFTLEGIENAYRRGADRLTKRHIEMVSNGDTELKAVYKDWALKRGLYSETEISEAVQSCRFNQFWEMQELMHQEDPFIYPHPATVVTRAVAYQMMKFYHATAPLWYKKESE